MTSQSLEYEKKLSHPHTVLTPGHRPLEIVRNLVLAFLLLTTRPSLLLSSSLRHSFLTPEWQQSLAHSRSSVNIYMLTNALSSPRSLKQWVLLFITVNNWRNPAPPHWPSFGRGQLGNPRRSWPRWSFAYHLQGTKIEGPLSHKTFNSSCW